MKKILLRSFTLATVVVGVISNFAFAQDAQAAASSAEASKFVPTMNLSTRYVLGDSTRKTGFDFMSQQLRLGGVYTDGAMTAAGEARFYGNTYGQSNDDAPGTSPGQGVAVRQAYIGYDLYSNDSGSTLNAKLGRFIPKGANAYGNDASSYWYGMSGFMPEDGIMLEYTGKQSGIDFNAQFAIANALPIYLYSDSGASSNSRVWTFSMSGATSSFNGGSTFGGNGGGDFNSESSASSNTGDKAYIASVSGSADVGKGKLEAVVSYGMKNNNVANNVTATVNTPIIANDVQYTEDSIGYVAKGYSAGVWYSSAMVGESKTLTADVNGGARQFAKDASSPKNTYSVVGFGGKGDSTLFGMTNVWMPGGLLTYSAGVSAYMHRQNGGTGALSDSDAAKNDVTMLSLGGGFTKGKFNTELNYSHFMASNDVFLNSGNNNLTNSADIVYLLAGFDL